MARVNRILSALSFGQIKKIYLEVEELPAFQALKKLESFLRVIRRDEVITLREFVEKLRAFILRESNTTLTEEQIADYRSYIRIRRVIVDKENRVREGGLSSGETLGVNLALCLSILFFLGREQGTNSDSGMLMLALDEAERLDVRALATIRDLLDEVRCQLMVAMPRPVDIADSICHLLTPLSQGVTHVHLYHRGGNGDINQTPCLPT
jgi:chromosome partition protein MukB